MYWFQRFGSDNFDLSDKECPGQLKKFDDDELQVVLNEDPTQTLQQLSEALGVGQTTNIYDRLKGKI